MNISYYTLTLITNSNVYYSCNVETSRNKNEEKEKILKGILIYKKIYI